MASANSPTVRKRRLCSELRRLREAARLTCDEVGQQIGCTGSRISRIESGRLGIRPGDVRELLDVYGVTGAEADALVLLAREARQRGWWQAYNDVMSHAFKTFVGLETEASAILSYESHYVPGLLQTPDYARELFLAVRPSYEAGKVERHTALRMARQSVLTSDSPPDFWVVMDEAVLRRTVGGPDIMRAQLERLTAAGEMPNVTLQVMPFTSGAHGGMGSGFMVFEFPDEIDSRVVYAENIAGATFLEEPSEITRCTVAFNHLRSAALPDVQSLALISQVAKSL
ncbi:transcriptional regulator with XRE-family HTH domain [Allocatelliglobosispora scoriae]|uniref:Transcriptional regulator with XRE-family HTH domain n=1 Tax=Allocatelliglobosispora scoriae TaxID=643052 RepID=A0A841BMC9_9ACTN|nr:helix-turn-helix transcriptional regulator [Allocatelliglobosispora scoriae]MBB5868406.1 transcriptional regulator with XRE-family HTH domain [Allocatelliglobosispora scoriae]